MYRWHNGYATTDREWTPWHRWGNTDFNVAAMADGTWFHNIVAPMDESDPNANHIHFKWMEDENGRIYSYVLCRVKIDGMGDINRRKLIDKINRVTGLDLKYR